MAKSKPKQTKKFIQKGHLAQTIKDRKRKQDIKHKIDNRKALRKKQGGSSRPGRAGGEAAGDAEDAEMDGDEAGEDGGAESQDEVLDDETLQALLGEDDDEDEQDSASDAGDDLADLEGEEEKHKLDIAALKEKDPEFYKYLEENDKGLLEFGEEDDEDKAAQEEQPSKSKKGKNKAEPKATVVTAELLKSWQKQMLQTRSLKALRQVLLCFRAAAASQADEDDSAKASTSSSAAQYTITSAAIFNKVVVCALKYTPLVLAHHCPYKEQANGRYKLPTQSRKYATAQRIIKSYFTSLLSLFSSLGANAELTHIALTESSRLVPYLVGNRKMSKAYLRHAMEFWSTARDDGVRLAAFLCIRKAAVAADPSLAELVLKSAYLTLQRSARQTTAFTLPNINMMKNTASTLFLLNPTQAYQIAFRYVRQLAITLRNALKAVPGKTAKAAGGKDKERYKEVYNWAFMHSIDFWSLVLASACDSHAEAEQGSESELRPLIYPLVQISLGVMRLQPTSRYYPLRFQLVKSLLRVAHRSGTYIPLAPFLLEVLDSAEFSRKPKGSSLKPLDWTYYIRAPAAYPRTRVYADGLIDEVAYFLLEFLASQSTSIAFPELSLPILITLRRHIKKSKSPKLTGALRALAERIEGNAKWIEEKREKVEFSPQDREQVDAFLAGEDNSPLRTYLKLQRKVREQKRELLERSLADDDDAPDHAEDDEDLDMEDDE